MHDVPKPGGQNGDPSHDEAPHVSGGRHTNISRLISETKLDYNVIYDIFCGMQKEMISEIKGVAGHNYEFILSQKGLQIAVSEEVLSVFDPIMHQPAEEQPEDIDPRWLLCWSRTSTKTDTSSARRCSLGRITASW